MSTHTASNSDEQRREEEGALTEGRKQSLGDSEELIRRAETIRRLKEELRRIEEDAREVAEHAETIGALVSEWTPEERREREEEWRKLAMDQMLQFKTNGGKPTIWSRCLIM